MKINPFAYHLWQRFWAIASPYWRGDERLRAWGLLALLVVLVILKRWGDRHARDVARE